MLSNTENKLQCTNVSNVMSVDFLFYFFFNAQKSPARGHW